MFAPGSEVVVLLAADGVMCAVTGVGWVLQRGVRRGVVEWEGGGWVLQNVSFFFFSFLPSFFGLGVGVGCTRLGEVWVCGRVLTRQ